MAHNPELINKRNLKIHERFRYYKRRNPKWMFCYVIEAVAEEFFLSPLTVERIIKQQPSNQPAKLQVNFS